jgi:hypothetical protein
VIPDSTNTWQSIIEAAPENMMMPANVLKWVYPIFQSFKISHVIHLFQWKRSNRDRILWWRYVGQHITRASLLCMMVSSISLRYRISKSFWHFLCQPFNPPHDKELFIILVFLLYTHYVSPSKMTPVLQKSHFNIYNQVPQSTTHTVTVLSPPSSTLECPICPIFLS